jgi:hypothetical protein
MTPILSRILQEKRTAVLLLAIGLVGNLLVYVTLVQPRGIRAAGVVDRAAAAARSRTAAVRDEELARGLVTGSSRADDELEVFYGKMLPASRDEARRMLDKNLPAMADETDVRWLKRTSEIADVGNDARLGQVTVNMVLQGDYDDLCDFLYAVESAPEFIVVDDVALSEGQANEPLTLIVRLSTFFRKAHGA